MADENELLERGMAVTKQLWGERTGGGGMPAQKLAPDFFKMVTEFCFGGFWSRPGLDVRSRSLCTVAQLAALGKTQELKGHLVGARNLGITREELIDDAQVAANDLIVESVHPVAGRMRQTRPAARFDRTPAELRLPAPSLGEHTEAILTELGYVAADRAALREAGTVA